MTLPKNLSNIVCAQQRPEPVISPEIREDHSVIFRLRPPELYTVKLVGKISAGLTGIGVVDLLKLYDEIGIEYRYRESD